MPLPTLAEYRVKAKTNARAVAANVLTNEELALMIRDARLGTLCIPSTPFARSCAFVRLCVYRAELARRVRVHNDPACNLFWHPTI